MNTPRLIFINHKTQPDKINEEIVGNCSAIRKELNFLKTAIFRPEGSVAVGCRSVFRPFYSHSWI